MDYFLGVAVSLTVEAIKNRYGTNTIGTMLSLLLVSLVGAAGYVYLSSQEYWVTITTVILAASTFHNLVLRQIQSK